LEVSFVDKDLSEPLDSLLNWLHFNFNMPGLINIWNLAIVEQGSSYQKHLRSKGRIKQNMSSFPVREYTWI
jgi:hypothetical protein